MTAPRIIQHHDRRRLLAMLPQSADGDTLYRRRWDDIRPEDRDPDRDLAVQADLDDAIRLAHIEHMLRRP